MASLHRLRAEDCSRGNPELISRIVEHVTTHISKPTSALHENLSPKVHIDVHIVRPSQQFPFQTLITSGMSERPMNAPEKQSHLRYAELCLALPPEWPLSGRLLDDDKNYWPVRILRQIARYPHIANTWVSLGHTLNLTEGNPPSPFHESTAMNSLALFPPVLFPESFQELKLPSGCAIHFLAVFPIHQDERDYAIQNGSRKLFERMRACGFSELLDPKRPSVMNVPFVV